MTTFRVRFHELDPYGHVNHAVYLHYFEEARVQLLDEIGYGLTRLAGEGFHFVVAEAHVRFVSPAREGDLLRVASKVVEVGRTTSRWHQRLLRGDELLASNELRTAVTDLRGRPRSAPEGLAEALAAIDTIGEATSG